MRNNDKKTKENILILLLLAGFFLSGCAAAASRIEKNNLIQVPELNMDQHQTAGDSFLVYGISMTGFGAQMHVKIFRLTIMENKNIKIKHGLSYSINLDEIGDMSTFEISRILKRYGYDSIDHFTKGQARATPIFPESDYIALPMGKGRELFDLASDLTQCCIAKIRKF